MDRSIVDCSIVVFYQRSLAAFEEYVYPTTFNPANSTITIDFTTYGVGPPVRPGDWIMDATPTTANGFGSAHAYFYRVVASEELGSNLVRYEVQQTIRGFSGAMPAAGYSGTAIVIPSIVEVFEKGPVRLP